MEGLAGAGPDPEAERAGGFVHIDHTQAMREGFLKVLSRTLACIGADVAVFPAYMSAPAQYYRRD